MQKIISLFKRDYDGNRQVIDEVVPGAEWVLAGEGVPTRKFDGTCCMIRDGKLYKRYDAKKGKVPPAGFEPAQDPDPVTGHCPGWVLVGDGPEDKWFREAMANDDCEPGDYPEGTYELIGPKVQGNPEDVRNHQLIPHGAWDLANVPRTYDGIKQYLTDMRDFDMFIEGIVWHREPGVPGTDMVKIKSKDFGIKR